MPRDSPRAPHGAGNEGSSSRRRGGGGRDDDDYRGSRRDPPYRDGRGRGGERGGGGPSRKYDDYRGRESDADRRRREDSGARYRDRDIDRDGRRDREDHRRRASERDDDRRREPDRGRDDRDSRPAGPSRRSASPRPRSSKPETPSRAESAAPEDKAKPNFAPSGLLAAATKTVEHGDGTKTVLKYHEPPEARKSTVGWRLYVFKGKEQVDLLHIHRQSAYLVGRDRAVVDISIDHPSCSKQHAVIQYRQVSVQNEFGDVKAAIKPFIIDLDSTNGTIVNDSPIPTSRYYELVPGDVIKFGESAREYVLLSDDAA